MKRIYDDIKEYLRDSVNSNDELRDEDKDRFVRYINAHSLDEMMENKMVRMKQMREIIDDFREYIEKNGIVYTDNDGKIIEDLMSDVGKYGYYMDDDYIDKMITVSRFEEELSDELDEFFRTYKEFEK